MTKSFGELFGDLIRERREAEGRSQKWLALEAFDDPEKVRRIGDLERGKIKNPHANTIAKIAKALGIENEVATLRKRALSPGQEAPDGVYAQCEPSSNQPHLSKPPRITNINYYGERSLDVLGRDAELSHLRNFLDTDMRFAWLQLAGVGGQGKSRLALELTLHAEKEKDWAAGLLETKDLEAFGDGWNRWQPDRPHLLVVDYIVGREDKIRTVFQELARRSNELRVPVRLLLLERQRWDRGGLGTIKEAASRRQAFGMDDSSGRAEWFLKLAERHDGNDSDLMDTRFESGVLELEPLDGASLVSIVRQVAPIGETELLLSDSAIKEQLAHIDKDGRPLYGYFLGQALASGTRSQGWTRKDLLDDALNRDYKSRWNRNCHGVAPLLGDDDPALRIAVLATMTREIDCRVASRRGLLPKADATMRRQALVLTDSPLDTDARGPSQIIRALQPDLLGEWLVLTSFEAELPGGELLEIAWRYAPMEVASFLQRLSQDFPDHPVTVAMLEQDPPDTGSAEALAQVAAAIIVHLYHARCPFPARIVDALKDAAKAGNGRAMASLGYCYQTGQGVERDLEQAVHWYREGAKAGNGRAMANLGYCYTAGQGVERDLEQAVHWYREGAKAGDGGAMANLGYCYETGQGVERDLEQAVHWYREGTKAGDGWAMANLGACYRTGQGVERDLEQAVHWYREGAKAGNGRAMANLGYCYTAGQGVERDLEQAVHWYREGAKAGDETARSEHQRLVVVTDFLNGANGDDGYARHLAAEQVKELIPGQWIDSPPLSGDWREIVGDDAVAILAQLLMAAEKGYPSIDLRKSRCRCLRELPLPFYPGYRLIDAQFHWPDQQLPRLCSGIIGPKGVLLLDGKSDRLHTINPYLLSFNATHAVETYLGFFCAFVRGDEGSFQVISEVGEIPVGDSPEESLLNKLRESIAPMQYLDGSFENDGWQRYEATILYSNAVFKTTLKLMPSGRVDMESDEPIAVELPILRRQYDGPLRTPPQPEAKSEHQRLVVVTDFLNGANGDDGYARHLAAEQVKELIPGQWIDSPPLSGDWREIVGDDAVAILAQLLMAAEKGYPSIDLRKSRCRCLRELPLPFYPGYRLIDAQFHWPDQQLPRLCSGIIGPKGVLLLDGKSDRLHTINPYLLSFNATHAVETYLGFFCAFVRGDEGSFQVISEVGEIPVGDSPEESLLNKLRESIAPMQYLDGSFENDGWQRYEATILYSNAVFKTTLKLMPSGRVDMESDEPIAVELPILRRQYDGPLRTPPQPEAKSEHQRLVVVTDFLNGANGDDGYARHLAAEQVKELIPGQWIDSPPLSGDWREIVGDDAVAILAQLLMAAEKGYPSIDLRKSRCRCLRELPLPFYPGYRLIDAQFHWPDQQLPRLCSGIIGPKGVLLLDGKSDRLHTINPYLLSFNATHAVETYLGFFCAFVRGDEGSFQVISEVGEIPVGDSPEESLLNKLRESIAPMQYLDGSFENDGWQRYEATILYSNAVFKTTLKLMPSGRVDMESDEPIAVELPILRRQYDGPLRTPPQPEANDGT